MNSLIVVPILDLVNAVYTFKALNAVDVMHALNAVN